MNNAKKDLGTIPFSELLTNESLRKAIDTLGFLTATEVQAGAIPLALEGKDLVVEGKTGSGKTLAFGLPMLSALEEARLEDTIDFTFGLVVAPTRELAVQISEVLGGLLPDLSTSLLIGGMSYPQQRRQLEEHPQIVIGTPGRLLDFMERGTLDVSGCEFFVLDEADEMFSMGFIEDVERILKRIPEEAQGMFVSATITPRVKSLSQRFLREPENVSSALEDEDVPEIEHLYCSVGAEIVDKPSALCDLMEFLHPESAIVFCNRKSETEIVEAFLRRRGFDARRLNSDLNQNQRNRVMARIRGNELRFLIATDIAARGIDIEQIEMVVNFSIHDQTETYVHRTGRTGRAGRKGRAISLISPHDFLAFKSIQKELSIEFKELPLPTESELTTARLRHLEENLEGGRSDLRERDRLLARKILKDYGDIEAPPQQLEDLIALLAQYTTENLVRIEIASLDEELQKDSDDGSRQSKGENHGRGRRGRNRNNSRNRRDKGGKKRN